MNRTLRVIIIMILILTMGIAIISSAGNGSTIGNMIQKSEGLQKIKKNVSNIFIEVLNDEYDSYNTNVPNLIKRK